MKRFLYCLYILLQLSACAQYSSIDEITKNKQATIGVAVADKASYWENSSRSYPLLSVFKLYVAIAVLDKVNHNKLELDQEIIVSKQELDTNTWSPMLKKYPKTGFKITLRELLYYMLAESDNNACDILIDRAGGIKAVQQYAQKIGLKNTQIKVTERQMNENELTQYQNTATLKDIIILLRKIDNNELFSQALHNELKHIMTQTITGADKIKKYLPKTIQVAHKTGSSSRINGKKIADNDVAIIKTKDKTYYLAIFVNDSYETDEMNAEIIATISNAIYITSVNK